MWRPRTRCRDRGHEISCPRSRVGVRGPEFSPGAELLVSHCLRGYEVRQRHPIGSEAQPGAGIAARPSESRPADGLFDRWRLISRYRSNLPLSGSRRAAAAHGPPPAPTQSQEGHRNPTARGVPDQRRLLAPSGSCDLPVNDDRTWVPIGCALPRLGEQVLLGGSAAEPPIGPRRDGPHRLSVTWSYRACQRSIPASASGFFRVVVGVAEGDVEG